MTDERCRLVLGDALEVLRGMETGSVGHVVTDPPYGQSNETYDRGVKPEVWRECYRVTGLNAALISFAGSPTYHRIASDIEAAGWKVRQMWAWVYRDGMITSAYPKEGFDRLAPAMDPICYATKGKVLLCLERYGETEWTPGGRRCMLSSRSDDNKVRSPGRGHWPKAIVSDGCGPFEYFAYRRAQPDTERTGHPNQKPRALMRWLVSKLPNTGPILDPYAGSATTLLAAADEGFEAIGIEADPDYHRMGCGRIDAELARHPLLTATA